MRFRKSYSRLAWSSPGYNSPGAICPPRKAPLQKTGPLYVEGDPASSVAICTLSSHGLLQALAGSAVAGEVAIIGPLETENLGIERMLTTLLQRPQIRWLVVCGDEQRGRYQGQALTALMEHGVDEDGGIRQARSPRARLVGLGPEHVEAVRRQVRLRNLVGVHDVAAIASALAVCIAEGLEPITEPVTIPEPAAIVVPARPYRLAERDPAGFFVIFVDVAKQRLLVEHYGNDGQLRHRLVGPDSESLCSTLIEGQLVTRADHSAYLGRELMKAEIALAHHLHYRQDATLDGWEE